MDHGLNTGLFLNKRKISFDIDFILSASGELCWKREYMLNFENSWNPKKDAFDLEMTKIEEKILFLEFLFDKDVNQKIKSSEIENLEKIKNFETKMKMQKSNSEPRNKLNLNIWF